LNNSKTEHKRIAKYIESNKPRAGVSIPYDSTTQLDLNSNPQQTGINTNIFNTSDSFGKRIEFIIN
jgi:hypothetical protein